MRRRRRTGKRGGDGQEESLIGMGRDTGERGGQQRQNRLTDQTEQRQKKSKTRQKSQPELLATSHGSAQIHAQARPIRAESPTRVTCLSRLPPTGCGSGTWYNHLVHGTCTCSGRRSGRCRTAAGAQFAGWWLVLVRDMKICWGGQKSQKKKKKQRRAAWGVWAQPEQHDRYRVRATPCSECID